MTIPSVDQKAGGPSKSATALSAALSSRTVGVSLLALDTGEELLVRPQDNPPYEVLLYNVGQSYLGRVRALNCMTDDLHKRLDRSGDMLLHNHGLWLGVNRLAAQVARKTGTPLVISTRGMLEPWALNYRKWKKRLAWHLYQQRDLATARLLHATAEQEAVNLRRLGLRQPIAVIANGVDIPPLASSGRVAGSPRTMLFLSRIHPVKGLGNLVDAWQLARPDGWRVRVAGPDEGGHRQEIEERVSRARLHGQFEFLGPVYDVKKWELFSSAELFVLPSFSENFGIVVVEALAAGLPVITTKGTPWKDLVDHDCGWWVDVGVGALADAISEATTLPDEARRDMGRRGRELIQNSYSWAKIATEMTGVYEWILGGGSPPACVMTD